MFSKLVSLAFAIFVAFTGDIYGESLPVATFSKERQGITLIGSTETKAFYQGTGLGIAFGAYINFCKQHNMVPASVENAQESAVITEYFNEDESYFHTWIGGWDPNFERNWTWINSGQSFNYTNWEFGTPIVDNGCVALLYWSAKWATTSCFEHWIPLCQLSI